MARAGQVIDNPVTGERTVIQETAADSGGRRLTFDLYLRAGARVPSGHTHPRQHERFSVIAGRMRFRRGGATVIAGPGDTVLVDPGTFHSFANVGGETAHVLVEVTPALRMEDLLRSAAELAREGRLLPGRPPRLLDLALFLREFRREVAPPLLPAPLVRLALAPLVWLGIHRGLDRRYRLPAPPR